MPVEINLSIRSTERGLPILPNELSKPLMHIIDDNYDMRTVIREEFEDTYRITDTDNGAIGFEKAIMEIPDVIISDVVMPMMDGITLCRKLKNDERTKHIPILLVTVEDTEQLILEGLNSGADDYIIKPFRLAILKAKVDNLLRSRRSMLHHYLHGAFQPSNIEHKPCQTDNFLQKAYNIIEDNLSTPAFEAIDFAKAIGMSRAQLYRKIKILTGYSVKEFVRVIRLKKAASMLISTNKNVSEIAYEVGFSSVAYFSTSFSEFYKLTPTQFICKNKRK